MDFKKLIKNALFIFLATSFFYISYNEFSQQKAYNATMIKTAENEKTIVPETIHLIRKIYLGSQILNLKS